MCFLLRSVRCFSSEIRSFVIDRIRIIIIIIIIIICLFVCLFVCFLSSNCFLTCSVPEMFQIRRNLLQKNRRLVSLIILKSIHPVDYMCGICNMGSLILVVKFRSKGNRLRNIDQELVQSVRVWRRPFLSLRH